jgi:hypothetical protein
VQCAFALSVMKIIGGCEVPPPSTPPCASVVPECVMYNLIIHNEKVLPILPEVFMLISLYLDTPGFLPYTIT